MARALLDIPVGRAASVTVPATTANLGPGFDSLGLALSWRDQVSAEVVPSGFVVDVSGLGAGTLPRDESHLMMASLRAGLAELGADAPGLLLTSHNTIPLAGGLGSSSAAIVAALGLAWNLSRPDAPLDRGWVFEQALRIEGHPDNVGPATFGGLVIAWGGPTEVANARLHPNLRITVLLVDERLETQTSRGALPVTVPFSDAAANSARAALLIHALGADLGLLLEGTRDFLHQNYRAELYPTSLALTEGLRSQGLAAAISGAGPTVAVFHEAGRENEVLSGVEEVAAARGLGSPLARTLKPGIGIET